jgi:hypothetical protein
MKIARWPIVSRAQLVQTFRPGEAAEREAPFRTMRRHRWATVGVRVVTREANRASGRFTIFSALNVEAARCAREGHSRAAVAMARAALQIEKGKAFARLRALLSGKPLRDVKAAVDGAVAERSWPELHDTLRTVARETCAACHRHACPVAPAETTAGVLVEGATDHLVLRGLTGRRTYVPRWLARSAHREQVGDMLALVTDRLDDAQMVVRAVPAIDLDARPRTAFTPFGREAPVRDLTAADARVLAGAPAPLQILVPVTIER